MTIIIGKPENGFDSRYTKNCLKYLCDIQKKLGLFGSLWKSILNTAENKWNSFRIPSIQSIQRRQFAKQKGEKLCIEHQLKRDQEYESGQEWLEGGVVEKK